MNITLFEKILGVEADLKNTPKNTFKKYDVSNPLFFRNLRILNRLTDLNGFWNKIYK